MTKLHRKGDQYIITDSCYWYNKNVDDNNRAEHEIEAVNMRTGGIKHFKCGSIIKVILEK